VTWWSPTHRDWNNDTKHKEWYVFIPATKKTKFRREKQSPFWFRNGKRNYLRRNLICVVRHIFNVLQHFLICSST
jgi:hypothetical protein